jgi:hypothetical protein
MGKLTADDIHEILHELNVAKNCQASIERVSPNLRALTDMSANHIDKAIRRLLRASLAAVEIEEGPQPIGAIVDPILERARRLSHVEGPLTNG